MKKRFFVVGVIAAVVAELAALIWFGVQTFDFSQDTVAVNEVLQSVTRDIDDIETHVNATALDYVVLNNADEVVYKTKSGLSESVNAAIAHRDTMLDVTVDSVTVGKIIVYNDGAQSLQQHKQTAITVISVVIVVQCAICAGYAAYLHVTLVKPFGSLKGFAERIAGGNLDIPLEMDKGNVFGAFTESFDIMRSELKKSRLAEAQANASKKELVAKLSHDIKTPVASIKAVAEVGLAVSVSDKDKANYARIVDKADQINSLVTNLFTATLEELQQLTVTPADVQSKQVKALLANADYLSRANIPSIPDCLVRADCLRLQQIFDNIFANSYKYSNTDVTVAVSKNDHYLRIAIEDFGGGVPQDELSSLKEKFKRGSNAANIEGAGLGLYIADYFLNAMQGELQIENGSHGLRVTVNLSLSGSLS